MNKAQRSHAFLQKRKMMMVLPLLVVPFLTMAFWALGGGKGNNKKIVTAQGRGLNLQLPNANLKDDATASKMSFYDQAAKDSLKLAEQLRNDPYFRHQESTPKVYSNGLEQVNGQSAEKFNQFGVGQQSGLKSSPYERPGISAEEKVMKKLAELNNVINQPSQSIQPDTIPAHWHNNDYSLGGDVDRLENVMRLMNDRETGNDPEMTQLGKTLDKILDIQHPERVKERTREISLKNKEVAYPVSRTTKGENISLLDTGKEKKSISGFFGLEEELSTREENNAIEAVVHENQVLVNGAVVKLRLVNDIYINGSLIPKGNFVFGMGSLNAERLDVKINSVRCNHSIYPVNLDVYDMDGLPGIYIPGAITREVAKQSVDNSLQLMELSSVDPSLKAQAAAAGISAAKSLLSRKVKQVKVLVKAGYKVMLKDKNVQQ